MDNGQHAVVVIDLVAAVAEALKANRPAGGVICSTLARATGAELGAWIALRPDEGAEVIWAQPGEDDVEPLVNQVLAGRVGGEEFTRRRVTKIGEIAALTPPELPGTGPTGAQRVLALGKRKGFTEDDARLLRSAIPAMTVMLSQVIAASERHRRMAARLASAKEYGLSERELEVLQLLSQGLLATSIASRLGLSPRTVHKHLGNIYEKMGVHDRLVAVEMARRQGLVEPEH